MCHSKSFRITTLKSHDVHRSLSHTLSSDPVQSPFENLEPPSKTFTQRFRDELKSVVFELYKDFAGCSLNSGISGPSSIHSLIISCSSSRSAFLICELFGFLSSFLDVLSVPELKLELCLVVVFCLGFFPLSKNFVSHSSNKSSISSDESLMKRLRSGQTRQISPSFPPTLS